MLTHILALINVFTVKTTSTNISGRKVSLKGYSLHMLGDNCIKQMHEDSNLEDLLDYLSSCKKMDLKFDTLEFFNKLKNSGFKDIDNHLSCIREMYDIASRNTQEANPTTKSEDITSLRAMYEELFIKSEHNQCDTFVIDYIGRFLNSIKLPSRELKSAKESAMDMIKVLRLLIVLIKFHNIAGTEDSDNIQKNIIRKFPSFISFLAYFDRHARLFYDTCNMTNNSKGKIVELKFSWYLNLIVRLLILLKNKGLTEFESFVDAYKSVLILEYITSDEFESIMTDTKTFYRFFYRGFLIMSPEELKKYTEYEQKENLTSKSRTSSNKSTNEGASSSFLEGILRVIFFNPARW